VNRGLNKKLVLTTKDGIKVYLVDGNYVKKNYNMDFVEGGHWRVYDYIPKGEVWVDRLVDKDERLYVIAHELLECRDMADGTTYNKAHIRANRRERKYRKLGRVPQLVVC
jgi:hypothetical protein